MYIPEHLITRVAIPPTIVMNSNEIKSNFSRIDFAERLILQLPENHDGRNSWLLNYGKSELAIKMRKEQNLIFDELTQSCELIS